MQYLITESDKVFEGEHFTGNIGAEMIHPDGKPYRTFRTQTVLAEGHRLTFKNCTFENTAGPGKLVGQAIALYLDGDDIRLENCTILGYQDSLFLAPLPKKEQEKGLIRRPDRLRGPAGPRTPGRPFLAGCGRGSGAWQGDSSAGILFLKILP